MCSGLAVTSFNPCSGGSASQTALGTARTASQKVSILVLVDRPLKPCLDFASFASSPRVSILVLVDRPLKLPLSRRRKESRTVSILVLVDRPLKVPTPPSPRLAPQSCFNPCSGGSASQTTRRLAGAGQGQVSILVLVDRPLKRAAGIIKSSPMTCFNPCSGGSASQTPPPTTF